MLIENELFGVVDKVKIALERLKHFEPEEGYYFADPGGKDSTVVRDLLIRSGVKYDGHYMNTTIDPPELVKFIREYHPETERHYLLGDQHARNPAGAGAGNRRVLSGN